MVAGPDDGSCWVHILLAYIILFFNLLAPEFYI